jgi:hypothetical protein
MTHSVSARVQNLLTEIYSECKTSGNPTPLNIERIANAAKRGYFNTDDPEKKFQLARMQHACLKDQFVSKGR